MSVAKGLRAGLLPAVLLSCGCLGCASAHYMVQNPDSGVIAIPRDTPALRAKAEKLMHEHLPQGYVIDDVRMVAVGSPYRTVTQVGFVREVQWHQDHEVLLTYHAAHRAPLVPVQPGPPPVQTASAVVPAAPPPAPQAPGLPPQPIPVGN